MLTLKENLTIAEQLHTLLITDYRDLVQKENTAHWCMALINRHSYDAEMLIRFIDISLGDITDKGFAVEDCEIGLNIENPESNIKVFCRNNQTGKIYFDSRYSVSFGVQAKDFTKDEHKEMLRVIQELNPPPTREQLLEAEIEALQTEREKSRHEYNDLIDVISEKKDVIEAMQQRIEDMENLILNLEQKISSLENEID